MFSFNTRNRSRTSLSPVKPLMLSAAAWLHANNTNTHCRSRVHSIKFTPSPLPCGSSSFCICHASADQFYEPLQHLGIECVANVLGGKRYRRLRDQCGKPSSHKMRCLYARKCAVQFAHFRAQTDADREIHT